ncbi:MAG: enoyl-CoA hydratase-related protein [Cytophagales bacterium]|nr:enoyl-CoA hydratase-related protein [Cytophagales bacterium]
MALIDYTAKNRIGYITLNRPDKRNALNQEMVSELRNAFATAADDPEAKVVVLKANGDAFCAGADLAYLQQLQKFSYEENLEDSRNLKALYHQVYTLPKVVIAQVEGSAIAGGSGLVTVCDFAFAIPEAKFGYTEVRIGFIPAIVMAFLLRKIGEAKARELLLTGKLIVAAEACALGMVTQVVDRGNMEAAVTQFAANLVTGASGQSLAATKKMMAEVQDMGLSAALDQASMENAKARATDDCKRGIASFLEKKELKW